jgi:hypothetical protein
MLRIYCDWNNRIDEERYDLGCRGSRDDIERYADLLREGLRVLFYQTDELEAEGVLAFDQEKKRWIAVPDRTTMHHIGRPASHDYYAPMSCRRTRRASHGRGSSLTFAGASDDLGRSPKEVRSSSVTSRP